VLTAGLGKAGAAAILTELAKTMTAQMAQYSDPRPIGIAGAEEASEPVADTAPVLTAADNEGNSE
jgi:hypothetical protein